MLGIPDAVIAKALGRLCRGDAVFKALRDCAICGDAGEIENGVGDGHGLKMAA